MSPGRRASAVIRLSQCCLRCGSPPTTIPPIATGTTSRPYSKRSAAPSRSAQNRARVARFRESGDLTRGQAVQQKDHTLMNFQRLHNSLYSSALVSGIIDDMGVVAFRTISKRLIEEAYTSDATAMALRRVSKDPERVYDIGIALAPIDPNLRFWAIHAGEAAGGVTGTLLAVLRHLTAVKYPGRTPALSRLEELALVEENPRAILVYCKVLGRREQHREAIALLEQLMGRIYPTKERQPFRDDITLMDRLEAPWWEYSWHKARVQEFDASEEMLRVGALEYQEPRALVEYAFVMWQKGDVHAYVECMNKAATAGNAEACLKLANYYYRTSREKQQPSRDVKGADGVSATILNWLGLTRTADDYRKIAVDWYEISALHGNTDAAFILAMILREDGDSEGGLGWLEHLEEFNETATDQTKKFPNAVRILRERWDKPQFQPKIPENLLRVDK